MLTSDFSDINLNGEDQPTHLFDAHELEQIKAWKRECKNGISTSESSAAMLVGQVCLPDFIDDLDWVTELTHAAGNLEFDSWLAKGPHRNRQNELAPIHLMGAMLDHNNEARVDRHDYYATWLPDLGITVVSAYSSDPQDICNHAIALGYIDSPYLVPHSNTLISILSWFWRWYGANISHWEFLYDDDSPCGKSCLLKSELVNKHLSFTMAG
jgi:hypothetical protein